MPHAAEFIREGRGHARVKGLEWGQERVRQADRQTERTGKKRDKRQEVADTFKG